MNNETLTAEILELATAFHAGTATDDVQARLERLLVDSIEARKIYLRVADDTVSLNGFSQSSGANAVACCNTSADADWLDAAHSHRSRWWVPLAVAVAILTLASGTWLWMREDSGEQEVVHNDAHASFARVLNVSNVDWKQDTRVYRTWDRLGTDDMLNFEQGQVEILYDNGVHFFAKGPAEFRLVSDNRIDALSGKLVARVSPAAIGFEITTPHAKVIDQGTTFGVTIESQRETDVVVYEGMVDLEVGQIERRTRPRLVAGEAMRIGPDGQLGRISSVGTDLFLPPPSIGTSPTSKGRLIMSVTDNLKESQTSKCYRVIQQGFGEDCQAFVDRLHQWNGMDHRGIPPFLEDCDYVMTFNDDKVSTELQMAVSLRRPARVYLLMDNRMDPPPQWITSEFVDTGWDIGIDEGYDDIARDIEIGVGPGKAIDQVASVWVRNVLSPGPLLLGPPREEETEFEDRPRRVEQLMYGIVAGELPLGVNGDQASSR